MNKLVLRLIKDKNEKEIFIKEVQEAFQKSYIEEFGEYEKIILPRKDIEESFDEKGSSIFFAEIDGERIGGVVVVIDEESNYNSLHLLYVKPNKQNLGFGIRIWSLIENMYPKTKIWETHTPYYDKRNIHFYVNRCGFKIVEFFNSNHKDPHQVGETSGNIPLENNIFFRFEKEIKR